MPDVVIVGGGVIGCAIAYELAGVGASVTLLERGNIAAEASSAAAGIMAPRVHATETAMAEFALRSVERFPALAERLREETGQDIELVRSGVLDLAHDEPTAAALQARARQQQAIGFDVRWLDTGEAVALEPAVNPHILGAYHDPDAYHVHPGRLTEALAAAAEGRGAVIRRGVDVTGLERSSARVTGLQTTQGSVAAEEVVLCAGAWTAAWGEWLGCPLPIFPVKGQILSVVPAAPTLRMVVWDPEAYVLSRVDGSIVVGATLEQVGFDKRVTVQGLSWLLAAIPSLCPSLADARFERAWAGLRPSTPDMLPIIGRLPGWENVTVATGHYRNGITLAPETGVQVAQVLTMSVSEPMLLPFSPARFQP